MSVTALKLISNRLKAHKQFAGTRTVEFPTLTLTIFFTEDTRRIPWEGNLPYAGYLVYVGLRICLSAFWSEIEFQGSSAISF